MLQNPSTLPSQILPLTSNPIKENKQRFNPYVNNEGSVMALAGKNYLIAAADKRLSNGYQSYLVTLQKYVT